MSIPRPTEPNENRFSCPNCRIRVPQSNLLLAGTATKETLIKTTRFPCKI